MTGPIPFFWRFGRKRRPVRARGLQFTLQADNPITHYRWRSFETKEPETLDWIDRQMKESETLFDIGANIGVYSVYAALRHRRATVISFEPEYANLHLLRDNLLHNHIHNVATYSIALADKSGLSALHLSDMTPGAALCTEAPELLSLTDSGTRVIAREGNYAMTLDDFCAQSGIVPHCIKLDVDGREAGILEGGREALREVRSILLELPDSQVEAYRCRAYLMDTDLSLEWQSADSPNQIWTRK